jgi:hypothetical protein
MALNCGSRPQWAESPYPPPNRLDASDVGGEEVDSVAVEVAACAVVVLGGPGVDMAGEDLGVAEGNAGVKVNPRASAETGRRPSGAVATEVDTR